MNYNLFRKEIKGNLPVLVLWTVVLMLLIALTLSVYPTFMANQSKVMGMMSLVPKGALEFKGISNISDLMSVLGFYAVNNVIYMMVLGSIYAIVLSSNIVLKEAYQKTAEYLMTRPVTRSEIFITKLAVVLLFVCLLNVITSLTGFAAMRLVEKKAFAIRAFLVLSGYTLLLNLLFAALGLFISTLVKRPKPVTTLGIVLVMVLYFVFTLSKITESIARLGYLSPFRFVRTDVASSTYRLDAWHWLYFAGISLLLIAVSYRVYLRKDIYT